MKLIFWFLVILLGIVLALFAVASREIVPLGLWPLPFVLTLPLYLAVLVAVLIGFIFGAFVGWFGARRSRRETRRRGRRITALEHELAATQARLPQNGPGTASRALVRQGSG
jgi:uncharacterized integral membrane protein